MLCMLLGACVQSACMTFPRPLATEPETTVDDGRTGSCCPAASSHCCPPTALSYFDMCLVFRPAAADVSAVEAMVDRVLAANPNQLQQYVGGKTKLAGFFTGQVMKESAGRVNPGLMQEVLQKKLAAAVAAAAGSGGADA